MIISRKGCACRSQISRRYGQDDNMFINDKTRGSVHHMEVSPGGLSGLQTELTLRPELVAQVNPLSCTCTTIVGDAWGQKNCALHE